MQYVRDLYQLVLLTSACLTLWGKVKPSKPASR